MEFKKIIKRLLGNGTMARLRTFKLYYRYVKNHKNHGKIVLKSESWSLVDTIYDKDFHCFFGYYDIQQIDKAHGKLLFQKIKKNAVAGKDKAFICLFDLKTRKEEILDSTIAWSWQQGARLRWHPIDEKCILFNDYVDNTYVTVIFDLSKHKRIKMMPAAFYDIDCNFRYGLSLNFPRLQRLRPGYGYSNSIDSTKSLFAPEEDGLWRYDLETGTPKMLISLQELAEKVGTQRQWNYLNHISFSPNGEKFMFFHIVTGAPLPRWKVYLYVGNIDGTDIHCIEDDFSASHYCWRNNDELLITTCGFAGTPSYYMLYNVSSGEKRIINSSHLHKDGHPTYFKDKENFVTDTYPQSGGMQHIFCMNHYGEEFKPIVSVYHDDRMYEEKRCDTHPRLTMDNKVLSFDTTYKDGARSIVILKHNE